MKYLAQANYATWIDGISAKDVKAFVDYIDGIHRAAETSKGYIWRYEDELHSTYLQELFSNERIVFNMTVWESIDDLKNFAFKNIHADAMKQRAQWFEKSPVPVSVLWWVDPDHTPTPEEARHRLALLAEHGPTADAFTFARPYEAT